MPRPTIDDVPNSLNYKDGKKSDLSIQGTNLGSDGTITVQYPKLPAPPTITWTGTARPFKKGSAYYLRARLTASNPGGVVPTIRRKKRTKKIRTVDLTDVSITATNNDNGQTSAPSSINVLLTDH